MNSSIIIRPLIGAVIGYVTNWIAVKMMFRPLKPIKFGKYTLPFTPGIIPKNKERLAKTIGTSISTNLITEDTLKNYLLSQNMKSQVKSKIESLLSHTESDNFMTFKNYISSFVGDINYNKSLETIKNHLTTSIYETVITYDLGKLISEQLEIAAKEKIKNSPLAFLGGKSIISAISQNANYKITEYIELNGKDLIYNMVSDEIEKYTSYTALDICKSIENSNISIQNVVMNIYEDLIIKIVPIFLNNINISKIVENKISSMNILELEDLILTIMKKELNSLINLGALIGFVLGLINLLF